MIIVKKSLLVLLFLYLVALIWLYLTQRSLLFHPTKSTKSKDGFTLTINKNRVWIEVRNRGKRSAIIYFPGDSEEYWEDIDRLAKILPKHTIYFLHYLGYGKSQGSPSQEAIFTTAKRVFEYVSSSHKSIDLIGRSLGTGVATYLASCTQIRKLVLITPYDSISAIGQKRYPIFPISLIIKDPFNSILYAPKIKASTLILLAQNDRVIPYQNSLKLIKSFLLTKPKTIILSNCTHSTILKNPEFPKAIRDFLEAQ